MEGMLHLYMLFPFHTSLHARPFSTYLHASRQYISMCVPFIQNKTVWALKLMGNPSPYLCTYVPSNISLCVPSVHIYMHPFHSKQTSSGSQVDGESFSSSCSFYSWVYNFSVALVHKKLYVGHYLSCRRFGEEPPRQPLTRPLFPPNHFF